MKKIFIIITIAASVINAQIETRNVSLSASAIMVTPISISVSSSELNFGEIILTGASFNQSIDPFSGITFTVNGNVGRNFIPTFSNLVLTNNAWVISNGGTLGNITFIPNIKLDDGTIVTSGNLYPLQASGLIGTRNLKLGGTISILASQPHGDYTGVFTMTVSY